VFNFSIVLSSTGVKTQGTLSPREIFVGRSKKCHLVLRDETVSGVHCRLVALEGGAIVMDEGSTNGTWLNGELVVQPTMMTADDELRVGPYLVMVQSLIGGSSVSPHMRPARSGRLALPPASQVPPPTERPSTQEVPTDIQLSQVQIFWRVLGCQQPGTLEEARTAYLARVEESQPDTVSEINPELRARAEQRLRELQFAWEYIYRLFQRAQGGQLSDADQRMARTTPPSTRSAEPLVAEALVLHT
jgi:predicted component of type VI protein secretion system